MEKQNVEKVNTHCDIQRVLDKHNDVWITMENDKDYVYCVKQGDKIWVNLGLSDYLLEYNLAVNTIYDVLRELNKTWDRI